MTKKTSWKINQRIVTRTEPQLGIGLIINIDPGQNSLEVHFPLTKNSRHYSLNSNSLHRFQLSIGDTAQTNQNTEPSTKITVESITEQQGLLTYHGQGKKLIETNLCHQPQDPGTIERFFAGLWTHHRTYDFRQIAWNIRSSTKQSPAQGLVSPKIIPLPHQLYVAKTISQYPRPRVLLADEVGLGKTIEAGLVFSALKAADRAHRVLIITPESLKHQWLSEMFRRFNELFTVFDEERYSEENQNSINPFLNYQKFICSIDFLLNTPDAFEQSLSEQWDLIIIDEAHHLHWSSEDPSPEWTLVNKLSQASLGVLLLTATPQLHGLESQFGLLNIVDSSRFSNFENFKNEAQQMGKVAKIAKSCYENNLNQSQLKALKNIFANDSEIQKIIDAPLNKTNPEELLNILIDRHGTGRVLFRNRRQRLKGFSKRNLISHTIPQPVQKSLDTPFSLQDKWSLKEIFYHFTHNQNTMDIKLSWLKSFLETHKNDQVLLLCSTKKTVLKIASFLKNTSINFAIFHEDLSIVERDIQAANFAQKENTQILICSEIGGEGRNFQFVQNMILFDLPNHPDIVEQRIGRLDRIGQKGDLFIHLPWILNSPEHILFKWYEQGLNSFESSWNGAGDIFIQFESRLCHVISMTLNKEDFNQSLQELINETKLVAKEQKKLTKESIDILIDLNSFNETSAQKILDHVDDMEDDPSLELLLKDLFIHYGVDFEEPDEHGTLLIRPSDLMFIEDFPGLKKHDNTLFTFDRQLALKREDIVFLTQDHPITDEVLSMLLDRNEGAASVCQWSDSQQGKGFLLELSFVIEPLGPRYLELETYFPTKIKELQINHLGEKIQESLHKENPDLLKELREQERPENLENSRPIIEPLIREALIEINQWAEQEVLSSEETTQKSLDQEIQRIIYLEKVNPNVTSEDIEYQKNNAKDIISHIKRTTPRLDSIRLIFTN